MVSTFQDGDPYVGHGTGYGPSSHNGDLQGVINSLDYIKDLGFNAIWMTPIFDSTGTNGGDTKLASTGYYATDYFNIDPHFGTNEKFKELVDAAHAKGIYVILDGVFGHHGGISKASPNGNWPSNYDGERDPVLYPTSLAYYIEVAQYWIDNYEIDGWRLDLCNQLIREDHNYLIDIRNAVYEVADRRRQEGKEWGILGYMVGEYWADMSLIDSGAYQSGALKSAFDFPFRYNIVHAVAQDENGGYSTNMLNEIKDVHRTPTEKGYSRDDIYPNLFIDNHDTFRLGNLIRMRHNIGVNNDNYWRFHKIAIGTLAVYSGPITLYYGSEIGDITDCWQGYEGSCQETSSTRTNDSSSSRTDGHINNFNSRQTDLHDFTKALMRARKKHPAMWRGTNGKTTSDNVYFNCKYDPPTGDKVVFVTNFNSVGKTVSYEVGGVKLYDFVSGEVIYGYESGKYNIKLEPYGTRVFQVYDEDVDITPEPVDCALFAISNNDQQSNDKKVLFVIVVAGLVCLFVIIIAVAVVIHMKKKYQQKYESQTSHPLQDMSLD